MLQSKIIVDLVKQTQQNYDMQDELHQILQNLEESIIIMQDFRAEFINDRYMYNIAKNLMDKIPEVEVPGKQETPSKLTRFKIWLKKCFKQH